MERPQPTAHELRIIRRTLVWVVSLMMVGLVAYALGVSSMRTEREAMCQRLNTHHPLAFADTEGRWCE